MCSNVFLKDTYMCSLLKNVSHHPCFSCPVTSYVSHVAATILIKCKNGNKKRDPGVTIAIRTVKHFEKDLLFNSTLVKILICHLYVVYFYHLYFLGHLNNKIKCSEIYS